jgi:cyclophilin family peptidyl-prolyl cis-trans isomerase
MNARHVPYLLLAVMTSGLTYWAACSRTPTSTTAPVTEATSAPSADALTAASPTPSAAVAATTENKQEKKMALDLTTDSNGLSKSTVVITTTRGVIKYKFYSKDAPKTVARMAELIGQGFYNGLTFHRVVPGFVIQGGDPSGNGTGGSGQKLPAEFNERRHIEGTVAMARAADPNSADSQFYISLGRHPHLDRSYTVFGQVTEGQDVAKQISVGDRMTSVTIE